ncbi:hypothetical protein KGQ34_01295 [Patescibacteria group bacterium]|nr:hypothetical protein [Patescibacteria group bacterium]
MEEVRIKNLIRVWREKSHQEGDQFASFVFIWFCFNAWMEHLSSKNTDAEMIKEVAKRQPVMSSLIGAYDLGVSDDDLFQNSIKHLVCMSREEPIKDTRNRKPPISIQNENDFENIVQAIYRIRCNLFHGGKDADDIRDQVLVKDAAMILRQWVGHLMASWQ